MGNVTLAEALGWLGPFIGAGGITAIIVAWLGTRKPAPKQEAIAGFQALLADAASINSLAHEMRRLADSMEKVERGIARYCDLMDIAQALDRLHHRQD